METDGWILLWAFTYLRFASLIKNKLSDHYLAGGSSPTPQNRSTVLALSGSVGSGDVRRWWSLRLWSADIVEVELEDDASLEEKVQLETNVKQLFIYLHVCHTCHVSIWTYDPGFPWIWNFALITCFNTTCVFVGYSNHIEISFLSWIFCVATFALKHFNTFQHVATHSATEAGIVIVPFTMKFISEFTFVCPVSLKRHIQLCLG